MLPAETSVPLTVWPEEDSSRMLVIPPALTVKPSIKAPTTVYRYPPLSTVMSSTEPSGYRTPPLSTVTS